MHQTNDPNHPMKKLKLLPLLLAALAAIVPSVTLAQTTAVPNALPPLPTAVADQIPAGANVAAFNTNGLDFTNVNYEVASGLEYAANGGALTYLQFNADLYHGSAVDLGLGAEATLSGSGPGLHSAELDGELIKRFSNFEFIGKAGVGGYIDSNQAIYGDVVAELNYNLTAGTGAGFLGNKDLFTYVGANVELQVTGISSGAADLNKVFHAYVGVAF
jgi:hypothetical protein